MSSFSSAETNKPVVGDMSRKDPEIAGQSWVCISFVSPESIIKQREEFIFEEFVKQWDMAKSIEIVEQFTNFIAYKYKLRNDALLKDLEDFILDQKTEFQAKSSVVADDFANFKERHADTLNSKFDTAHSFQTSVRGLKIRGSFATYEEAEMRGKFLAEADPAFDVSVGPVGMWLPWDPDMRSTGKVEYMDKELNELIQEKSKNEKLAKMNFDARVAEAKQKAMEDNMNAAAKNSSTVTQTLDEHGNLIGTTAQEVELGEKGVTTDELREILFEGENIVTAGSDVAADVAAANAEIAARLAGVAPPSS